MKPIVAILAILFAAGALAVVQPNHAAAVPDQETLITVTAVSAPHDNGWTVSLSNGITFFVEIRVFDTGGKAPKVGKAISNFKDQGWLPILGYYGYTTFSQGDITYHAYR